MEEAGCEGGSGILPDRWKGLGRGDCIWEMGEPSLQHAKGNRSKCRASQHTADLCGESG